MLGVLVTIIFLACAFAAGFALSAIRNARFNRVWTPLMPLITGTPIADCSGGDKMAHRRLSRQVGSSDHHSGKVLCFELEQPPLQ